MPEPCRRGRHAFRRVDCRQAPRAATGGGTSHRCTVGAVRITFAGAASNKPEIAMKADAVFHVHPDIMSGAPVFIGTRVPVRTLLDYLESGDSLDDFLEDFPGVERQQAVQFLEQAAAALLGRAA